MVELIDIKEDNFYAVLALRVADSQRQFVGDNANSLAYCYLYRNDGDVFPKAIFFDGTLVGFLLLEINYDEKYYLIWRLMIDEKYQKMGYGKAVIQKVIELAKAEANIDVVYANYVKGNTVMKHLLEEFQFVNVGVEDNEVCNELKVGEKEKLGEKLII